MQAEIGTFIMGGFETTAHTLSFTLFALATNPAVQARMAEELAAAGLITRDGIPARQLEYDNLRALPYLCNVLRESMRMFPVVAGIPRSALLFLFCSTSLRKQILAKSTNFLTLSFLVLFRLVSSSTQW